MSTTVVVREAAMSKESATTAASEDQPETKPRAKKTRGRVTVIRERCKGCGYCVAFCPMRVLEMSSEFNEKGYHFPQVVNAGDCTGCDLCGMYCPDFAISGARVPVEPDIEEPDIEKQQQGVKQRVRRKRRDPNRRALP